MAKRQSSIIVMVALFALLTLLLIFPVLATIILIAAIVLVAILSLKFAFITPAAVLPFLVAAIILGEHAAIAAYACLIGIGIGLSLALCIKGGYVVKASVGAVCAILSILIATGSLAVYSKKSPQQLYADYITANSNNKIIAFFAQNYYDNLQPDLLSTPKLSKDDPNYLKQAVNEYALSCRTIMDDYLLWYISGYAAFTFLAALLFVIALNNKRLKTGQTQETKAETTKAQETKAQEIKADTTKEQETKADTTKEQETKADTPKKVISIKALKFNNFAHTPISEMRLTRMYLLIGLLPALVFSIFGVIELFAPITRTITNLLITIPLAFCGFTLLLHCAIDRFTGKAKTAAIVVVIVLTILGVIFYDAGLLIGSLLGFADCVLNIRHKLDWALSA